MNTDDGISPLRIAVVLAAVLLAWMARPASAMTFSNATLPDGTRYVVARGPVVEGDSVRLRAALQSADRDAFGNKLIALDSPGGPIVEAFALVDVMDRERVSTLVRRGDSCASACAQILFLSGLHRIVEPGGRIGFHSCHDARDRTRSTLCNELIAQNAAARGTPYASIVSFVHLTAPTQVRWLDATEAELWGFVRRPPAANRAQEAGVDPKWM
jgi:hypothetical protein